MAIVNCKDVVVWYMCICLMFKPAGLQSQSEYVFLDSPALLIVIDGSVAAFNCIAPRSVIDVFFEINDTSVNMRGNDPTVSVVNRMLSITTNSTYNNTAIRCTVLIRIDDNFTYSDPVSLRVQGLLAAPGNLYLTNMIGLIPQPVVLRWDAPFSLDITGVDPDISNYTVFITNLNTSRNGSETVPGTEFEFTNLLGEAPNPCYIHSFTVSALNLAGEGNSSEPVMGNIREVPQSVSAIGVTVTLFDVQNGWFTVLMEWNPTSPDCSGTEPEVFVVNIVNGDGSSGCVYPNLTAQLSGEGRLRINFTTNTLKPDEFYAANITAINAVGSTPSNGTIEFTTFDLQNVIIHLNGTFMCQYIGGSVAQGCLVIARQNKKVVYAIILRIQEDAILFTFAAESGEAAYEILGFDLEQNGTFGTQAAVSQRNATMMGILVQEFDNSAISEAIAIPEDGGLICVNCTFVVGSDVTGCVVIMNALENMQQLLSHTISRDGSGTFAQGCFPVFSSGDFLLALFAVGSNGPLGTAPGHVQNITILVAATTPTSVPTVQPNDSNTALIAGAIVAVAVVITASDNCVYCILLQKRETSKRSYF